MTSHEKSNTLTKDERKEDNDEKLGKDGVSGSHKLSSIGWLLYVKSLEITRKVECCGSYYAYLARHKP